jgi:beta-glucosidase
VTSDILGNVTKEIKPVMDIDIVKRYFNVSQVILNASSEGRLLTDEEIKTALSESDFVIIKLTAESGANGEQPQNLTYSPYTAIWQREESLAFDWVHADGSLVKKDETPNPDIGDYATNRSRNGKTHPGNPASLELIEKLAAFKNNVPVVCVLNMQNPCVPAEFEPISDAILAGTGVSDEAFIATIRGENTPTGILPVNMPINMATVELSYEDTPHDMVPYFDSEGNHYAFGFGLTYGSGGSTVQIKDSRYNTYVINNKYIADGTYGHDFVSYPRAEIRPVKILSERVEKVLEESKVSNPTAYAKLKSVYDEAVALLGTNPLQSEADAMEQRLWSAIEGSEGAEGGLEKSDGDGCDAGFGLAGFAALMTCVVALRRRG